jgi:hypothetical protein
MSTDLVTTFKHARRADTSLVAITTSNAAATMETLTAAVNGETGVAAWDIASGIRPLNRPGEALIAALGVPPVGAKLAEILLAAPKMPPRSVLFLVHAHRFFGPTDPAGPTQALWNLRDALKGTRDEDGKPAPRTVVLLAPSFTWPPELAADVMQLDEPLPDDAQLTTMVGELVGDDLAAEAITRVAESVRGLPLYPAEQAVAMAVRAQASGGVGVDLEDLRERRRAAIEQTPGLAVERGGVRFAEIGGNQSFKTWAQRYFAGPRRPRVVVRLDEFEKMMGGTGGGDGRGATDSSGTSTDRLGVICREMEDQEYGGCLTLGPPGTGKTFLTTALHVEFDVLGITADFAATADRFVGSSEQRIRALFKTIRALAGRGGALFVATCNDLSSLKPEVRRRFERCGLWYFDLPTHEERRAIWTLTLARYPTVDPAQPRPDDTDWTGADIRNCVDNAYALGCTLREAAAYLVPIAKSDPEKIDRLRGLAAGRFLSASTPGTYTQTPTPGVTASPLRSRRAVGKE